MIELFLRRDAGFKCRGIPDNKKRAREAGPRPGEWPHTRSKERDLIMEKEVVQIEKGHTLENGLLLGTGKREL